MKTLKQSLLISLLALLGATGAQADAWSCRKGGDVREVNIERLSDAPVPCNVVYSKLTEGVEDQVLWNAQVDPDYCSEKAEAFVVKLGDWGWTCVETIRDEDDE